MVRLAGDPTPQSEIASLRRETGQRGRSPNVPGPWCYIETGDPDFDTGDSPPYQDGTTFAGEPYAYPAFRKGLDGAVEWKGHVDVSGASSPATLCTMPVKHRPSHDVSWVTDLLDGGSFVLARVSIVAATGVVTLTWPAS